MGAALSRKRLGRHEWQGALEIGAGLALFFIAAGPDDGNAGASGLAWIALIGATTLGAVAMISVAGRPRGARRAGCLAVAAGLLSGLLSALTKTTGHAFGGGAMHALVTWQLYALMAVSVLTLVVVQSAYQAWPITGSYPLFTAVDVVATVAMGALAMGESVQTSAPMLVLQAAGLVAVVAGVFRLGRSPIVLRTIDVVDARVAGAVEPA